MRSFVLLSILAAAILVDPSPVHTQDQENNLLGVGETAPEFALPGATRYGLLKDPVSLSDYRGETVVLAFFFRARTRG